MPSLAAQRTPKDEHASLLASCTPARIERVRSLRWTPKYANCKPSSLAAIQQEQQSVYQQFQMIQTLRRDEFMAANPPVVQNSPVYSMGNPPPNYDDLVREKQGA